ncbi:nuclear transport factor 2 family protein [Spirosoma sp. BT702]|uniref:Nuclear transport factor 2 family protein n=1 Tax=Spirosoma profusum TaxID=2771354 RepID=A0A927AU48_9BACT|nr:nuclear transport factor 2 family protein [Spirosoma profusum]MBD2702432.1 nuclear transport factor 2 family protein [Spirosoma profusum]
MKSILMLCLLVAGQYVYAQAPVAPSAAATSATQKSLSADEKAVIDAEKQRFAAQVSGDYDFLNKVLAADLVYTHSNGNKDSRETFIQSLRSGKSKYESIDPEEQNVRLYGNTAVINGVCLSKVTSNGQTNNLHLRYLSVYVKNNNQWQMVAWQSLRMAN